MGLETALPNPAEPAISTAPPKVDRASAMAELERRANAGEMSPQAAAAYQELKNRGFKPPPVLSAPSQNDHWSRPAGLVATGFNKGVGGFVDLLNSGLKEMGLPMSDEPFMGTAFIDKYLAGAEFHPQNLMESVLQRSGFEIGANMPLLAGAERMRMAGMAAKDALPVMAETKWQAFKNIPAQITEQLKEVGPVKLAAVESALAAGAGTGAEIVHQVFPEGGRMAEFVGELIGGFTPSVVLGMLGKAKELVHSTGRAVLGMETEAETKRRLGKKLSESTSPEEVEAGVKRADELNVEVSPPADKVSTENPELKLSTGSVIRGAEATQKAEAKASAKIDARLNDQRRKNVQAVYNYFNETAPEGNPARLVERLESERAKNNALLQVGLDRTQAKVDGIRGSIDRRTAAFLDDMEARLFRADQDIDARLRSIGPQLNPKQRGEVIRQAHNEEIGKWREKSRADYHELDMLGDAELPVSGTISKLADLETQFPAHLQAIRKINPRVASVIDNLGRDYELQSRVDKAQADLGIAGGKGKDQRGGFRLFEEQSGQGGTQKVTGFPSNYPDWYRSLTTGNNPLDRETVEKALDAIKNGGQNGLEQKTIDHVKSAIKSDREFRTSPFFDPVMDDLNNTPSANLKDLRQLRSDLLSLNRSARASNDRTQGYVLNELTNAVDHDINQLLPGESVFADRYPEHAGVYRRVSADYRAGIDRLMKGSANKIRQVRSDGSYTMDDESIPALFWRNETGIQEFEKAFPNQDMAKASLRDYALERFYQAAVNKDVNGKLSIDARASQEWIEQHQQQLKAFPELESHFKNTQQMGEDISKLQEQLKAYQGSKAAEERLAKRVDVERRPGDFSHADLAAADTKLNQVQAIVERTKHEWEKSKAGLFLKESPEVAANRIVLDREPVKSYESVVAKLKGDPEAIAGLNKSIWTSITDAMQPRLTTSTGELSVGTLHKTMQTMLEGYGGLMQKVLGPDGYQRVKTASEVIEKIATGTKPGSDTAINLQVHAALASSWLSRAWATLSGRVPFGFGAAERGAQYLIKTLEKHTAAQQEGILLEAFYNPKVFQTLVNAAQYGPENALVKHQMALHLHALNLSEQMDEGKK